MGPTTVPGTEAANQPVLPPASNPAQVPAPPGQTPPPPPPIQEGTSQTNTIIVVIALFLLYPLGVILMYVMTKWKWWVKLLLTLPFILFLVGLAAAAVLIAVNPKGQLEQAQHMSQCAETCGQSADIQACVAKCMETTTVAPTETENPDTMPSRAPMNEEPSPTQVILQY